MFSIRFSVNKLALNARKTKFILFTASNKLFNDCLSKLHFDIHIANRVDYVCYLGLTVDCNFTWKFQVNCVKDKIARGVSLLKKCSHFMPDEFLRSIYFAFIYPYLQ